jgi:iron complex transport system ATP-binding protein
MYCTYLYVLKEGKLVAQGKPEEIITRDLVRQVYEVDCEVLRHPSTGRLYVVYFPGEETR